MQLQDDPILTRKANLKNKTSNNHLKSFWFSTTRLIIFSLLNDYIYVYNIEKLYTEV